MLHAKEGDRQYDSIQADEEKYKHFTLEQCKELLHRGHSVQSHSKHHYILSSLDDIKVEVEIAQSKKQLEDVLNQPVNCFAYPFGDPRYDFGDREKSLVQKAGYALGFSGEMKSVCGVTKDEDNYSISRFGDVNHDFLYFQLLLSPIRLVR